MSLLSRTGPFLAFLASVVVFTSHALFLAVSTAAESAIDIKLGQTSYRIDLAITSEQRRRGLMHRQQLGVDEGMLLVYPRSGDHRVWMKNMLIPLRVFWIDESFTVLDMQRLEPCKSPPCPVFSTPQAARYILELGDYEHALKPGDKIDPIRY